METQDSLDGWKEVLASMPGETLRQEALRLQFLIQSDPSLVSSKENDEIVTDADHLLQAMILQHLSKSSLYASCRILAEEDAELPDKAGDGPVLIIDPLDGTNPLVKGQEQWGVMVGVTDAQGILRHSWNMVSTGQIYSSGRSHRLRPSLWASRDRLHLDVFDYTGDIKERFHQQWHEAGRGGSSFSLELHSSPAACWAGWQLYNQQLDGLVWVSSEAGKRTYPPYDLVFLGALKDQGWHIALGKRDDCVHIVTVGPGKNELEILWMIARELDGAAGVSLERHDTLALLPWRETGRL